MTYTQKLRDCTVTVIVPTLAAGEPLDACLQSLRAPTLGGFEVIVVDNSGQRRVKAPDVRVLYNETNAGFGAAVNQGIRASTSPFIATLNDDAEAHPDWLAALVQAMQSDPGVGMCASHVRLDADHLDSAGMLIAADGSSKQRGHRESPRGRAWESEVLCPSGSAAMYRRTMLDEVGAFDEDFLLYCEDTDLGLRARWAGWRCVYVAGAEVDHRYSHSAGRASPLKAYYVERNRLFLVWKNFPLPALAVVPFAAALRYLWHVRALLAGEGVAAEFRGEHGAGLLVWLVIKAHLASVAALPALLRKRRAIRRSARISSGEFLACLRRHAISLRQVAAL